MVILGDTLKDSAPVEFMVLSAYLDRSWRRHDHTPTEDVSESTIHQGTVQSERNLASRRLKCACLPYARFLDIDIHLR